jgi:hypothetical protein
MTANEEKIKGVTKEIGELTKYNDHTQALIMASMLLDNLSGAKEKSDTTNALIKIRENHYATGHMISLLNGDRYALYKVVMAGLRKRLSPEQFKALHGAM